MDNFNEILSIIIKIALTVCIIALSGTLTFAVICAVLRWF